MSRPRLEINLGGKKLVAEVGAESDYREIFIGIEDKDGSWIQDLAIVGEEYEIRDMKVIHKPGVYTVKVYSDRFNEDYTHEFCIEGYDYEESE